MPITNQKLVTILAAGDMAGSLTSDPFSVQKDTNCAIQAVFSGSTPTGTFHLKASNDGVTYTTIDSADTSISASGDILWNITNIGFAYLELVYTRVSGTGTCTVTAFVKESF